MSFERKGLPAFAGSPPSHGVECITVGPTGNTQRLSRYNACRCSSGAGRAADGWQATEGQDDEAGEEVPAWPMQEPGRGLRGRQHLRAPGTTGSVQDCGGTGVCQHNRQRSRCKDCGGASICQHNRLRSDCKDCGGTRLTSVSGASTYPANRDFEGHVGGCGSQPHRDFFYFFIFF